jgi:hypothetical protein
MKRTGANAILASCVALAVSSSVACDRAAHDREARGHEGAPINLTGCLQKDPGITTTYILTQVNEPSRSVGTSGSAGAAEQERLRSAKHAYRLDGDGDQLEKLVGKQVKVAGTIAENSDLNARAKAGDQRPSDARRDADIDTGDLAKVRISTIAQLSDACGGERP